MKKYLNLYKHFLKFSLSNSLQFRFDFTFRIFMDCIYYLVNILFFKIIFTHTNYIEGWAQYQVMIFVSGYLIIDAFHMTFFSNNMWMISTYINKGDLDYYLLRPVSDLFFLSLREFAFNSFVNLLIAIGIAFYFIGTAPVPFDIWHIALYFLLLLNGAYLHLLLRFITVIPVFWTHSGRGLEMIFWTAERFAERPDAIYKGWTRYLLMTVIPFVALCSFPARALFGENTLQVTVYCLAISLIFTFIVRVLWKLGLKNYSSASS